MAKTISFVATDELAEWIEEESERRMTTVSSTAQQLLAEKYREEAGARENVTDREGVADSEDEVSESGTVPSEGEEEESEEGEEESEEEELPEMMQKYPDRWYVPDSAHQNYAVRMPEDATTGYKYYKEKESVADRLRREYE